MRAVLVPEALHILDRFHIVANLNNSLDLGGAAEGEMDGRISRAGLQCRPEPYAAVVNESEAEQVREIFGIFLRPRALIPALEEIQERGFRLKSWTTRKGECHAGRAFDRHSLVRLLSNVVYLGQVKYQGNLRNLAPLLQEQILDLRTSDEDVPNERALRRMGGIIDWRKQIETFERYRAAVDRCTISVGRLR